MRIGIVLVVTMLGGYVVQWRVLLIDLGPPGMGSSYRMLHVGLLYHLVLLRTFHRIFKNTTTAVIEVVQKAAILRSIDACRTGRGHLKAKTIETDAPRFQLTHILHIGLGRTARPDGQGDMKYFSIGHNGFGIGVVVFITSTEHGAYGKKGCP